MIIARFQGSVLLVLFASSLAGGCGRSGSASLDRELIDVAKSGDAASISQLLERGANVNARNESQRTVLMLAALKGRPAVVSTLVAKGADINARDTKQMTALMWAAFGGSRESAEILISHGADVRDRDAKGETALDWAKSRSGNEAVIEFLQSKVSGHP
jgi:ankyrin repeat protein